MQPALQEPQNPEQVPAATVEQSTSRIQQHRLLEPQAHHPAVVAVVVSHGTQSAQLDTQAVTAD
jgi:hypothetical protein